MWRLLVVGVCVGCSGPAAVTADAGPPADADLCELAVPNVGVPGCQYNGLAALSLDGAWTLTGTIRKTSATIPYSGTRYIKRNGSGRCALTVSTTPIKDEYRDPASYLTDTVAVLDAAGMWPHTWMHSYTLCVSEDPREHPHALRGVGGARAHVPEPALIFEERIRVSMPQQDDFITGVLTRE